MLQAPNMNTVTVSCSARWYMTPHQQFQYTARSTANHKPLTVHQSHKHSPVRNRFMLPRPGPPDLLHCRRKLYHRASSLVCDDAISVGSSCSAVQHVWWMAAALWPQQCIQTGWRLGLHCTVKAEVGFIVTKHTRMWQIAHWLEGRAC